MAGGGLLEDDVDVLICSPKESFWSTVKTLLSGFYPYRKTWVDSVEKLLEAPDLEKVFEKEHGSEALFNPLLAIVDAQEDTQLTSEWVQALKMSYPHVPAVVLFTTEAPVNHAIVKKNGATRCMHYPFDAEYISDIILDLAPVDLVGDSIPTSALVPVDLEDFAADTIIPCSMFLRLPTNNKTLCLRKKNGKVDERTLSKFRKTPSHRVYIKKTELKAFYEYAREHLPEGEISSTERFQKTKDKIQSIMSVFLDEAELDYDEGKEILKGCEEILEDLQISKKNKDEKIKTMIRSHTGHQITTYNEAINVCVYSAIFAQLCRFEEDEIKEIAIAGLLHNIGLSGLSTELVLKNPSELEDEEWEEYKGYPKRAIFLIKRRKVPLLEISSKVIEQAWERIDGSGIPRGSNGVAVSKHSRIVHIAIEFNKLTQMDAQGKFYSARPAIEKLIAQNQEVSKLDLRMLNLIYAFFKKHYKTGEEKEMLAKLVS